MTDFEMKFEVVNIGLMKLDFERSGFAKCNISSEGSFQPESDPRVIDCGGGSPTSFQLIITCFK